jgi:histidinol-phosphate aminotransferase
MIKIPEHIQKLNNYKPGKPIKEIIAENHLTETAILWNNENNLGMSPRALAAMQDALSATQFYPDPMSTELRKKIAVKLGKNIENIIVGNGSESILLNILTAFCWGEEDELLTSEGTFVITYIWAQICNVPCKKVPLTADYRFDMDAIYHSISEKTKVIYLSNANNPTGAMITQKEMDDFLAKVPPHILVIIDEAYFEYSKYISSEFPDSTLYSYDNIITLRSFSKAYGIAGIRIGYGIATEEIINTLLKVKLTFEPSNIAQAAGIGALDDEEFLHQTIDNNKEELEYYYNELKTLGINFIPSYANFVMIDCGSVEKATSITQKLMDKGIFIRQLNGFGLAHCIRISVGTPQENKLCIHKLKELIAISQSK